ncbi:hypothetical protein ABEB36_013668 [Hypothenemus hampei]|uniref:MADF domain-containing protein n=1 Tax=Hypothenemus hampei TaxID=57062 RepID=A0ABD1E581_HYPHA
MNKVGRTVVLEQFSESNSSGELEECYTTLEELLITFVQARPILWDYRIPIQERSKSNRDRLWKEIFEEFGENPELPIDFLQKKWKNLRDTYIRLRNEYTPSGAPSKKKKEVGIL